MCTYVSVFIMNFWLEFRKCNFLTQLHQWVFSGRLFQKFLSVCFEKIVYPQWFFECTKNLRWSGNYLYRNSGFNLLIVWPTVQNFGQEFKPGGIKMAKLSPKRVWWSLCILNSCEALCFIQRFKSLIFLCTTFVYFKQISFQPKTKLI